MAVAGAALRGVGIPACIGSGRSGGPTAVLASSAEVRSARDRPDVTGGATVTGGR